MRRFPLTLELLLAAAAACSAASSAFFTDLKPIVLDAPWGAKESSDAVI